MDVKYLNLDEVSTGIGKMLKFDGAEYEMKEMSVGDFLDQAQAFEAHKPNTPAEIYASTLKSISTVFPTFPEEKLRTLTMAQINAIMSFINAQADEINEAAAAVDTASEDNQGNE